MVPVKNLRVICELARCVALLLIFGLPQSYAYGEQIERGVSIDRTMLLTLSGATTRSVELENNHSVDISEKIAPVIEFSQSEDHELSGVVYVNKGHGFQALTDNDPAMPVYQINQGGSFLLYVLAEPLNPGTYDFVFIARDREDTSNYAYVYFSVSVEAGAQSGNPISASRNATILDEVWSSFAPEAREIARRTPVIYSSWADTAFAHTSRHLSGPNDSVYVGVSLEWDNTVGQSVYRDTFLGYGKSLDDPVFSDSFKHDLLVHELLHVVQDELIPDMSEFYSEVVSWYLNEASGVPAATDNYAKMILWHNLYGQVGEPEQNRDWQSMRYGSRYVHSIPGVEEFAYLGELLVERTATQAEVSCGILNFYVDIIEGIHKTECPE